MTLIEQLTAARKFRGMTARELAKRSGVTHTYISALEHENNRPRIDTIERLAEAMDMQVLLVPRSLK